MEYTVQKLGRMAGVSARTLRYYDEIGILKPGRINSSGYRIYGQSEVDRLQQILFYRELDVSLDEIKRIITDPSFDSTVALINHRKKLIQKRDQLDTLIVNVTQTLESNKGGIKLTDKQKFEGFKQKMISENEEKYGDEIREKYGEEQVNKANQKIKGMTEAQFNEVKTIEKELQKTLNDALQTEDPSSDLAQKAASLHRQWLSYYWASYSKEAHAGLAQMYVDDERFTAYYDKEQPGTAQFLREAIHIYTGIKK